ncbi:MAG: bifunctional cytidylyltransferase/SDR family oxidoreductase [Rhabdochlamydiaceae bacterium]
MNFVHSFLGSYRNRNTLLKEDNDQIKAILLLGGTGLRFGSGIPKQFHRLAGKKVYLHTLETFLEAKLFEEIILVCPTLWIQQVSSDIAPYCGAPITVIEGGSTRQESSFKGLQACGPSTQIVVIHDGVRPFISGSILKENVEKAIQYKAVDTCIPSADTLVHTLGKEEIVKIPNRSEYLRGQTPQSFDYSLILSAHLKAQKEGILNHSDDCSLVLKVGHPVHIVMGSEENIKITSELDLLLAEQILRLRHFSSSSLIEQESLAGKKIVVTGGTGGIGKNLCHLLEEEGAIPISISRSSSHYPVDLTSYHDTRSVFEKILQEHGRLDGLVNGMGLLKTKQLDELSPEEIDLLIATNLTGVIYCCKCVHLKQDAHIINIASSSYIRGKKNYAIYASAKAAVVNFTQGLAEERPDLLINALVPQRTNTPMRLDNFPDENPSTLLDPKEVAIEIVSLLKQKSITGTTIEVKKT